MRVIRHSRNITSDLIINRSISWLYPGIQIEIISWTLFIVLIVIINIKEKGDIPSGVTITVFPYSLTVSILTLNPKI